PRVFEFLRTVRLRTAAVTARRFAATRALQVGAIQNEAIHAVEQVARKLEHLLGGGGKLGGTGRGLVYQFAHLVHGADNGLGAGRLLFDGGSDFLGNVVEAASGVACL